MVFIVAGLGRFLVVGAGLGLEYLSAWWSGAVITCFTVVTDLVLRSPDRGWGPWLGFLAVVTVTGVQGWRDRSPDEHRDEHAARGSGLTLGDTGATLQKRNDQPE